MSEDPVTLPTEQQLLAAALSMPVPRIYINGFQIAQSWSDVMIVAQTNGGPTAVLNLSFTTAKSLAIALTQVVETLEASTAQPIMTMEDVQTRQQANRS